MDAMLGRIIRKLVLLPEEFLGTIFDLLEKLTGADAKMWIFNLKKFLRQEQCWIPGSMSTLLKRIKENITVAFDPGVFIASDRFKVDTGCEAEVKISFYGDNFSLRMFGLEEQPPDEGCLCCHELFKASVDGPIIQKLGGKQKAETILSEIFALMKKQRNGEEGVLLTNGYANIFYVRDINIVLHAVYVDWCDGGWRLNARPVEEPLRWNAGDRVFSRNSLES